MFGLQNLTRKSSPRARPTDMLLQDHLDRTVGRLPDKAALICGDGRITYAELSDRVETLASALAAAGVTRSERVALFFDNDVDFVVGVYATLKVGAVFMPINVLTKSDKLAYMLADSRAAALLTHFDLADAWKPALAASPGLRVVFAVGPAESADDPRVHEFPVGRTAPTRSALPNCIDQDLASIIYTSGSTGFPKGVMLSHLNMLSAVESVSTYLGMLESDVVFCALPLAFDYGLYQVLMSFKVGATVVLERNFSFPMKVLARMQERRVTIFPGVPTMFAMLLALGSIEKFDLGSVRIVTNTAAALSEAHIGRVRALFPQASLFSMYGLTECKRVTYLPPEQLDVRPTSVGRGMPNEEVWLVDEHGERLPNGSTGELVVRGSNVMRGYWEKPAETAHRLRPGPLPGEMVLYTGDIFRTDSEGWLYFVSRRDDIIKSRGEKVSPREVENVIQSLDGVYEVAVIGVPDDVLGQAVKAFVVASPGRSLSDRDVIRHCSTQLESFMVPRYVEFVTELAKTDTGKIKKTGLA